MRGRDSVSPGVVHFTNSLWSPYSPILLLAQICDPQTDTHSAFAAIGGHAQCRKKFESSEVHVPSCGRTRRCPAFLFQL